MINVLIVDDHKMIRDGIKLMLKNDPIFKIIGEADNGLEAINYIDSNPTSVNVVLMDINMPIMDGISSAKSICKKFSNIKILAVTMYSEAKYIIDMLNAGAHGYILKESSKDELMEAIKIVNSGKKYYSREVSNVLIDHFMNNTSSKSSELTERELEILSFIAGGYSNVEIANELLISNNTVDVHRRNILDKLKLKNTASLVRYAIDNNLKIKNEST